MTADAPAVSQGQLDQLRVELVDLAFTLEGRGRLDAADLALAVAARLAELSGGSNLRPAPSSVAVQKPGPRSLNA